MKWTIQKCRIEIFRWLTHFFLDMTMNQLKAVLSHKLQNPFLFGEKLNNCEWHTLRTRKWRLIALNFKKCDFPYMISQQCQLNETKRQQSTVRLRLSKRKVILNSHEKCESHRWNRFWVMRWRFGFLLHFDKVKKMKLLTCSITFLHTIETHLANIFNR